jgi:hypothetical protein
VRPTTSGVQPATLGVRPMAPVSQQSVGNENITRKSGTSALQPFLQNEGDNMNLSSIKMPTTVRKRGRPKGAELTVAGIPRKKKKFDSRPVAFSRLPTIEKFKRMLSWFVADDIVEKAINGDLIAEENVETRPNRVSVACIDQSVCLESIQHYFNADAWLSVVQVVQQKKKQRVWPCPSCNCNASTASIMCDCCLQWFHKTCVGLNEDKDPKATHWFCPCCIRNAALLACG